MTARYGTIKRGKIKFKLGSKQHRFLLFRNLPFSVVTIKNENGRKSIKRFNTRFNTRKVILRRKDGVKQGYWVKNLASSLEKELSPHSSKIEITGSIRRKVKSPKDIDFVIIPKKGMKPHIRNIMKQRGKIIESGEDELKANIKGVDIDIFFTKPKSWGSTMFYSTGSQLANIGRRTWAKNRGMKLNRWGVFDRKTNKYLAGKTERDVFKALKRKFKKPEDRG